MFVKYLTRFVKSSLFKSAGIYTAANILNVTIPFLLLPILTRYLSPEDYGIVAMFSIGTSIVGTFVGLSIHGAIGIQYFKEDRVNLPRYITNCFYITAASSIAIAAILWIFSIPISKLMVMPRGWLWAVWVVAVGNVIITVNLSLWQAQAKPFLYGVFQVLLTTMNLGLSVLFVVFLDMKFQGRILAQVASTGVLAYLSFLALKRSGWFQHGYRVEYIKDALKFGVPVIPHFIGGMAIVMTDRLLIAHMVGITEAGIYTVGAQIGMAIGLMGDSFNCAWQPWLYDKLKSNVFAQKIKIVKFTYCYNILAVLVALLLTLTTLALLRFFVGKNFLGAGVYVFWIILGYAFREMYKMVANYICYAKKTYLLAWVTFITAAVNIFVSYYLIRLNGAVGAAQGTMLTWFLTYIFTWILSAKVYKMPWTLKVI